MKILFLQDFSMARNGGGVSILKRLMQYAPDKVKIKVAYDAASNPDIEPAPEEKRFATFRRNIRFGMGRIIGSLTILGFDFVAARSLKRIIQEENPDIIHLVAHGVSFPATARAARKSGKKIVLSVHDVWSWTVSGFIPGWIADNIFKSIIKDAETVYVISKEMEDYLRQTYGEKNYQVVHDGIAQQLPQENKATDQRNLSLLYVGILHDMQVKQFSRLVEAMGDIPEQHFTIGLCSNTKFELSVLPDNVTIVNYGWQKEEEVKAISRNFLFGLLPLSFEPADELFYRTSLMTKIPFYTSVLLPIICIGPETASAVNLIQRQQTGIVCTSPDRAALVALLHKVIQVASTSYPFYINKMKESAATVFNIQLIGKRFYDHLPVSELSGYK